MKPAGVSDSQMTPIRPLAAYGWTADRQESFAAHAAVALVAGRVVAQAREVTQAVTAAGPVDVVIQRGFRRAAAASDAFPAVGDWLALEAFADGSGAALREVLPRTSAFARGQADARGRLSVQVVAANVDTVLLVSALTRDLNLRRLERYLALAWASRAQPVVILNKSDLADDREGALQGVAAIAGSVPIHAVSARTGEGLGDLEPYLAAGRTLALLGSSGVGKSTITNVLLGEERQLVRDVREDDHRGRHTTTGRELFVLPGGALLIDTPGMRSIGLWEAEEGLDAAFTDIERLAQACRFTDCLHAVEPGCAVRRAIEVGELAPERLRSRRKLERELASAERRSSVAASRADSRRFGRMIRDSCRQKARLKGRPEGC